MYFIEEEPSSLGSLEYGYPDKYIRVCGIYHHTFRQPGERLSQEHPLVSLGGNNQEISCINIDCQDKSITTLI